MSRTSSIWNLLNFHYHERPVSSFFFFWFLIPVVTNWLKIKWVKEGLCKFFFFLALKRERSFWFSSFGSEGDGDYIYVRVCMHAGLS